MVRVRDYLPLQQGLRLCFAPPVGTFSEVRDYLPLQQGLRRVLDIGLVTKVLESETIFHYNKD